MKSFNKESFLLMLKFRPHLLIGKQIIYDKRTVKILDISVSGDYLCLEKESTSIEWKPASSLEDSVIVDITGFPNASKSFTVASVLGRIEAVENHIGHPSTEQSKPLFEIVAALNKELLELRLKIEDMEVKEKNYVTD